MGLEVSVYAGLTKTENAKRRLLGSYPVFQPGRNTAMPQTCDPCSANPVFSATQATNGSGRKSGRNMAGTTKSRQRSITANLDCAPVDLRVQ